MFNWLVDIPALAWVMMLAMYLLGLVIGRLGRKPIPPKTGTADELIQSLHDEITIKAGRHDKVNVAGVRCYTAIATKDTVLFVNMDKV